MELQYYGGNCVRITTKKATITIDDNLKQLGQKSVTKSEDISLFTGEYEAPAIDVKLIIDQPGEYEVSDISIQGVAARAHIDEEGKTSATMFRLLVDEIGIAVVGHIFADLSDEQVESLGHVDVLIIPVGNTGFTLDGADALKVIKKIEPKLIIPIHFADKAIKYEVPQVELEEALKGLAMEPKETVPKLKLKVSELPLDTQLIVLERQ
jgi:L-ascorbate metabolism protein UlaG (beta-lactamase superfamily)